MTRKIRLREICHSRSGDKGSNVNIGIAVYDQTHYQWVKDQVTEEVVTNYLKEVTEGHITRYELPKLGSLNFLVRDALGGGASRSLMTDGHGKSFSSILLDLQIEAPPDFPA